jgi:tetratricopeptide (TPR) repeat protein
MIKALILVLFAATLVAQEPPRSGSVAREHGQSSSKDTKIDITAPAGDSADHPDTTDLTAPTEMRPWNPHQAMKDVEVGDFYFKRGNYSAAINRYRSALEWKPRDAIATFRLAQALERSGRKKEAVENYQAYTKILPHGEYAEDCKKAIQRLSATEPK